MRCLDSIPVSEDVQVIVVDDCSPDADSYPQRYPQLSRPYLEFVRTTRNGGAGYARNVGLEHAKGKWLMLADADDYFVDKTLRINYLHIGNKDVEQVQIDHFTVVEHWNGTRSQLVEPYHYGDILIEVLDQATQKLLYSRSYSCLFTEYRTTERGETEIARMEECVNMPMPKSPVRVRLPHDAADLLRRFGKQHRQDPLSGLF